MAGIENMDEIIIRKLQLNISPEENGLLESWLDKDETNRAEFETIKDAWELSSRLGLMHVIDVTKARKKVKKEIPEFKKSKHILFYWQRIAAIFLLPLLLSAITFFYFFKQRIQDKIIQQEVSASFGVRTQLNLPDGTNVWLNSGSKIKFPSKFLGNKREVYLEGEALFNVADDVLRPFYVNLGEVSVKAVGTTFNVTAYKNDNTFETTLIDGKVLMVKKSKSKPDVVLYKVEPSQHAVYNKTERKIIIYEDALPVASANEEQISGKPLPAELLPLKEQITDNKYTSWIEGKLIFRNDPMDEVIKRLGRWYNVDINLNDTILYDFRYTATFIDETLEQVLDLLKLSAPINYTITERKIADDSSFSKKIVTLTLINKKK